MNIRNRLLTIALILNMTLTPLAFAKSDGLSDNNSTSTFMFDVSTSKFTSSFGSRHIFDRDCQISVSVSHAAPGSTIVLTFKPKTKDAQPISVEHKLTAPPSLTQISLSLTEQSVLEKSLPAVAENVKKYNQEIVTLKGNKSEANVSEYHTAAKALINSLNDAKKLTNLTLTDALAFNDLINKISQVVEGNQGNFEGFLSAKPLQDPTLSLSGIHEDGTLTISVTPAVKDAKPLTALQEVRVAKREGVVTTLSSEIALIPIPRRTYTIALKDATNNQSGYKIYSRTGDPTFETNISGGIQFVFDEQAERTYKDMLELMTLGLYEPGYHRFGVYMGGAVQLGDQAVGANLAFSWFLDRELKTSVNYGIAFRNADYLLEGFKADGDISQVNGEFPAITRKRLRPNFFISFKWKP